MFEIDEELRTWLILTLNVVAILMFVLNAVIQTVSNDIVINICSAVFLAITVLALVLIVLIIYSFVNDELFS